MSERDVEGIDPEAGEALDPGTPEAEGSADEAVRTGDSRVDAVLESLEGIEDLPVGDHVAFFERAHGELRQALDAPPDDSPDA